MATVRTRKRRLSRLLLRALLVVPVALLLGWVTGAATVASVTRYDRPQVAVAAWPNDAEANARLGELALQRPGGADLTEVSARAERAYARSPLNALAVRVLGFTAAAKGDRRRALALVRQAAALSRRDPGTQLWLIDEAVRRNDVDAALDHYDLVMRTSTFYRSALFPVLSGALADPEYVAPVRRLLAREPNWGQDFVVTTLQAGIATENVGRVLAGLKGDGSPSNHLIAQAMVGQAAAERRWAVVRTFYNTSYARAAGSGGAASLERLSTFDAGGLPPFVWTLTNNADRTALGAGKALTLTLGSDRSGPVASRLLLLRPGRYRLAGSAQGGGARLGWALQCGDQPPLVQLPLERNEREVGFSVPPDCPAQTLTLSVLPGETRPGAEFQVPLPALVQ